MSFWALLCAFLFRYNTGLDLGFIHLGTQYVLCSFPWLLRPLIPLSRSQISRVPGPHWAVNGEHQTHTLAFGARIKEAGFLSVKWSGSLLLLPLPSGSLVLSERECFFPSTVRVLRLGEELNESVRLTNPSLRASSSSDFANILRWQADRRSTGILLTSISSEAGYRIYNLTFYSISYCA